MTQAGDNRCELSAIEQTEPANYAPRFPREKSMTPEQYAILTYMAASGDVSALRISAAIFDRQDRCGAALVGNNMTWLKRLGLVEDASRGSSRTPRLYRITEAGIKMWVRVMALTERGNSQDAYP